MGRSHELFGIGSLIAMSVLSASSPGIRHGTRPAANSANPAVAALRAYGSRGTEVTRATVNVKLDGALADISRSLASGRVGASLADLHALHPAARFRQSSAGVAEVLVDAVTRGDPQQLRTALVALGLEHPALYSNDVSGWLPVAAIESAAVTPEVHALRAALPRHRAAVATQGDFVQGSAAVRSANPTLTGTGVTVGVLSDSFNCFAVYAESNSGVPETGPTGYAFPGFAPTTAAEDESSGALPSTVNVVQEVANDNGGNGCLDYGQPTLTPFTDEGRAMLQIVHAVAPGASLAFYTADNGEAAFATGIQALANAGATVEADDAGYYDEPYFQDGLIAQAVDAVESQGVAYFSAAGNDLDLAYDDNSPNFGATASTSSYNSGEYLLNFDPSGATTTTALSVSVPQLMPGEFVAVVLEWDQPYITGAPSSGGATSQLDLCITGVSGNDLVTNPETSEFPNPVTCSGPNAVGADPVQVLIVGNPATNANNSASQTFNVVVGLANGTTPPGRIKLAVLGDGAAVTINEFATHSSTMQGHPIAAGAMAVGAAFYFDTPRCGTTPAEIESFSSEGGALPILFSSSGVRLATPTIRQKPNFVGPDGVNDTFLGYSLMDFGFPSNTLNTTTSECQTNATYPSFFGTSAATPHAAGIAALMLQGNSALTPTQIYTALENSALAMPGTTAAYAGTGFIQADAAFALIPPPAPALSFSASSVTVGTATTLTWSSVNATGCTASGSWSGAQNTSGTLTVTPSSAGSSTYSLMCANSAGQSTQSSATLTATAPASSGHGGGRLDLATLLLLLGVLGFSAVACQSRRSPRSDSIG
jgi:hypothetical protein